MVNSNIENMKYCIHGFMITRLKLSGAELIIFALIRSFTKGEGEFFFGTQGYLAEAVGTSTSTVKRALTKLLERGYIEKISKNGRDGYISTEKAEQTETEPDTREDMPSVSKNRIPSPIFFDQTGIPPSRYIKFKSTEAKYNYYSFSPNGAVMMTPQQYYSLLKLVDEEKLKGYCARLEQLIFKKQYRSFSHYKTIKKWIYEDAKV